MKITIINGTEIKGCTYNIKEIFLSPLRKDNELTEFYLPKDMPYFCCGCKRCFLESEDKCPHAEHVLPIWDSILDADLIVFATPVYALRVPGQLKALFDHFCCHWFVHRPEKAMFSKRAVILTNAVGVFNSSTQKDIATSLSWMGVSSVRRQGFALMDGIVWDELSEKRRKKFERKTLKLSEKYKLCKPGRMSFKVKLKFFAAKMLHKVALKNEEVPSADNRHWIENGWI